MAILVFLFSFICIAEIQPLLINGTPVPEGEAPEVVRIQTGSAGCTATVVGKRVIVTAAHCGATGQISKFKINGVSYSAVLNRNPKYPGIDIDVSVGISDKDIDVVPANISSERVKKGDSINIMGYGCINPGGGGGNDGILREGENVVTRDTLSKDETGLFPWRRRRRQPPQPQPAPVTSYDFVSSMPGGGTLCFGDSGGPVFNVNGEQVAVNSKGDIRSVNYTLDLTHPEVQKWLLDFSKQKGVEICGINVGC